MQFGDLHGSGESACGMWVLLGLCTVATHHSTLLALTLFTGVWFLFKSQPDNERVPVQPGVEHSPSAWPPVGACWLAQSVCLL